MSNDELTISELLHEAEFAHLKANTLRVALERGAIPGRVRGKTWFTTRQGVRDYLKEQNDPHKPGRKMRKTE